MNFEGAGVSGKPASGGGRRNMKSAEKARKFADVGASACTVPIEKSMAAGVAVEVE